MSTIDPINTISIQQFIQQVKTADSSKAKELRLSMDQAKNLAFTLGIVMARLNGDLEKLVSESKSADNEVIEVNLDGGSGWK